MSPSARYLGQRVQIDVLIPTWNKAELLADCLVHLEQESVPHQVIVADNGSQDGTVAMVRRRFPEVRLVELGENLGFGRAVNRAAAAGTADALVVINNDVNVEPGFLFEIVRPFSDARVGMVAGVLLDPVTSLIDAAGVEIDPSLGGYAYMAGLPISGLNRPPAGLLGPCGGAAAYRRRAFEAASGFDERIFVYSEDLDLALRLRAAGWRCALAPRARGFHVGSATLGARTVAQVALAAKSRGYVLGRYRVGPLWVGIELAVAAANALLLRSAAPIAGRVRGWRAGRAQAALTAPDGCVSPALSSLRALRRRLRAAFPTASPRPLPRRST
jgi:GT2 family glycosyltransferase